MAPNNFSLSDESATESKKNHFSKAIRIIYIPGTRSDRGFQFKLYLEMGHRSMTGPMR